MIHEIKNIILFAKQKQTIELWCRF